MCVGFWEELDMETFFKVKVITINEKLGVRTWFAVFCDCKMSHTSTEYCRTKDKSNAHHICNVLNQFLQGLNNKQPVKTIQSYSENE